MHYLASHLSADGTLAAWFLDRVLPSLISGLIVALVAWWLSRSFKAHVEAATISQTNELRQVTEQQTQAIEGMTAEQTRELKSRQPKSQSPPGPPQA